jgi:hypothetical protein
MQFQALGQLAGSGGALELAEQREQPRARRLRERIVVVENGRGVRRTSGLHSNGVKNM